MRNEENIYHILRGQSAITSSSLIWKYITTGKRNIEKQNVHYFFRWNDMQYTTRYNAKNYHEKQCLKLTSFFEIVCTILLNVHLKNKLLIWTQQGLIYYIYCKESLEYITMQRFLSGSTYFLTGTVLMIDGFAYTLAL